MATPDEAAAVTTLAVDLGRRVVRISGAPAQLEPVRAMFSDQVLTSVGDASMEVTLDPSGRIRVDGRLWEPEPDQPLCDQLMYALMRACLDAEPERLHLHAGCVSLGDRSLIVAGAAGSGKSTLIAHLVRDGFDYFGDERIALGGALDFTSLAKPISVVSGSFAHLGFVESRSGGAFDFSARVWHIPASSFRASQVRQRTAGPPRLGAILFVHYRDGASAHCDDVHPATAARLLLSDALDADRFGDGAIALVARLCASVPCRSMVHGGGSGAAEAVRRELAPRTFSPSEVAPITPGVRLADRRPVTITRRSVLGVASRTVGVRVGERALVRTASGDLVELDEVLTAWLLLLDGRTPLGALIDEVAKGHDLDARALTESVTAAVAHLATLGVAA